MKRFLLACMVVLFLAGTAQADLISEWDMSGLVGTEVSQSVKSTAVNITGYDIVRGAGLLTSYTGSDSLNSNGWDETNSDDYFELGFNVADGFSAYIDELWVGARSSNTGPGTMGVYTSLDDYGSAVSSFTLPGGSGSSSYVYLCLNLSSLGAITGDFYIRFYEIGNTQADGVGDTASGGTFRITNNNTSSNVQITGAVSAVPVPGALWLMITGILGFAGYKRKRN